MEKLIKKFGITQEGAKGVKKASFWSVLVFFSYMLPMLIIMLFLQDSLNEKLRSPLFYTVLLVITAVLMFFIHYVQYNTTYRETYKEAENLRVDIAKKMKDLPLSYFSKHDIADLSQTIMKDVADIEQSLSHAVPQAIGFVIYFVIMSVLLILGDIRLGLAIVLPVLFSFGLFVASKKYNIRKTTEYYQALRENSDAFQETIELQQEIRSYGQVERVKRDLFDRIDQGEKIHWNSEIGLAIMMNLSVLLLKFVVGFVIILGTSLYLKNEISLLYFLGYLIASVKIADALEGVYEYLAMMFFFDASYKRIGELKNAPKQGGEKKDIRNFDIEVKDVEFTYPQSENKVIDGISFVAKQNEVTALVGPSGCGKTTVLRLISRLYDYDKGEILVDGKEIQNIATESLFEKVSFVFQDITLFNGTVMDNIRIGKKGATDEEVRKAAELANVDEIVSNLPQGYDTLVGENGNRLSGGERQRISIARAILKDAPIIILDEISASLDVENEMKIQKSLNHLIQNKTVVIISHRLKSIENADKIIVMEKGKIDAMGKHEDLCRTSKLYQGMLEKSIMTENFTY